MFEQDEQVVQELLSSNPTFRELYEKHRRLKETVSEATHGVLPLDDLSLMSMKKEKLRIKDRMAHMIQEYRHGHA